MPFNKSKGWKLDAQQLCSSILGTTLNTRCWSRSIFKPKYIALFFLLCCCYYCCCFSSRFCLSLRCIVCCLFNKNIRRLSCVTWITWTNGHLTTWITYTHANIAQREKRVSTHAKHNLRPPHTITWHDHYGWTHHSITYEAHPNNKMSVHTYIRMCMWFCVRLLYLM